jgi:hypothetical protein
MMYKYFLDVVDAGVSSSFDWFVVLVIGVTIIAEAITMLVMKYNPLKKVFVDSTIVNIATLLVGYILIRFVPSVFNSYQIGNILLLLAVTVIVETALLYLLNRAKAFSRTLIASVVMNLVSYTLFYLFVQLSNR